MAEADLALDALGDPTRRRILARLRDGERTVADLTAALPVTQSAVSQHLARLRQAGLVVDRPAGRRRYYRIDPDGLAAVRAYVDAFCDDVLDASATYSENEPAHPAAPSPSEKNR